MSQPLRTTENQTFDNEDTIIRDRLGNPLFIGSPVLVPWSSPKCALTYIRKWIRTGRQKNGQIRIGVSGGEIGDSKIRYKDLDDILVYFGLPKDVK